MLCRVMQAAAPPSPSSVPRPSAFQGQAVEAPEIGGEAKRRKSEDTPRGFVVPSPETCMTPANVRPLALSDQTSRALPDKAPAQHSYSRHPASCMPVFAPS